MDAKKKIMDDLVNLINSPEVIGYSEETYKKNSYLTVEEQLQEYTI